MYTPDSAPRSSIPMGGADHYYNVAQRMRPGHSLELPCVPSMAVLQALSNKGVVSHVSPQSYVQWKCTNAKYQHSILIARHLCAKSQPNVAGTDIQ